ncbi:MAG: hypothetical protein EOP85_08520 [Verrucomicrobiaceae bacterium]|nr:MAG: hypothetical protein EOP85_08520 [Verrucomicrobiaceae bacterium]
MKQQGVKPVAVFRVETVDIFLGEVEALKIQILQVVAGLETAASKVTEQAALRNQERVMEIKRRVVKNIS